MIKREEIIEMYENYTTNGNVSFEELTMALFQYQSNNNLIYNSFLNYLNINYKSITKLENIPFLPVSLFKNYIIKSGYWIEQKIFESSATSGFTPSKHYIRNLEFYYHNARLCFEQSFGELEDYCFFALLPSYMERDTSSLIFMVNSFIDNSKCGGFYKYDYKKLLKDIEDYQGNKRIVLLGVTYALLEMANKYPTDLGNVIVMETGGMKGRGRELPREEMHEILKKAFNIDSVYSEYGMTELLSQAYSKDDGIFKESPTMKIVISDIYDPFSIQNTGRQGKINIIDVANIDSCCFLSTDDLGIDLGDGKFKVLGRTDESDIRGCNLLFE